METIGGVKIDEDESSILDLDQKFVILKRLCTEEMKQDKEIYNAKLRYEKRIIERRYMNRNMVKSVVARGEGLM